MKIRTTLNGVVSEQTYNVPHIEEAPQEEPEAPEVSEEVLDKVLNKEIYFGKATMDNNTITILNTLSGEPVTDSTIKSYEIERGKYLEDILNEGRPNNSKYKVELKLTQLKYVGAPLDSINAKYSIFSSHLKVTKPNGDVVEKDIPVYTFLIDTL